MDLVLNLGCGNDPRPGMLNVDRRGPGADAYMDASDLAIDDRCVARLEAHHLVEHLGWVGCTHAFCEWFRVMRPGASLVIETPDLPETARRFGRAGFEERALLAAWIYGKESPGMGHRFGFEPDLLFPLLRSCGFVRIRRQKPETHGDLPGLGVTATRGRCQSQEAHARFKRIVRRRAMAPSDQDLAVELHRDVASDLVRNLPMARHHEGRAHALMARLAVYDPEIARAALDACAGQIPAAVAGRWRRLFAGPEMALLPRALTAALLARAPEPGRMQATFETLRDQGRRHLLECATENTGGSPLPGPPHTMIEVRPFSPAGLGCAAQEQTGLGLRAFAHADLFEAERHLGLAAAFNSNLPVTFWNLSRIERALGRRDEAGLRLDQALLAARRTGSRMLRALARERDADREGRVVPATPVSPARADGGVRP